MDAQTLIAGVLVVACSAWAAWTLLPAGARAWCLARLGLRPAAPVASGCGGCGGCAGGAPAAGQVQVVRIVRRPRA
ncbi:MAG: hypothetical protein Q7U73_20680 [Rubrivivax sp.]|nr:hypothetical protein [Rubrivivax sp.]